MTADRVLPGMSLGQGAEFDAIRRMLALWGERAQGIGDDAAVIALAGANQLVVSVDASVEGVHFRPGWLTPREIGWRAAAAALSDLAAMAASPLGVLMALTVPNQWMGVLDELAEGYGEAAAYAGAPIVGGNLSGGDRFTITTTVLGAAERPLRRSGASAGDDLYVTGRLGGPGHALQAFLEGNAPPTAARARFAHPEPRIREALWLAGQGATAAIDISDGLHADAGHLAAASGVTIELDVPAIPCLEGIAPPAALTSGEEYELLITAPPGLELGAFEAQFGIPLTRVGRVVAGGARTILTGMETRVANAPGHDHFST